MKHWEWLAPKYLFWVKFLCDSVLSSFLSHQNRKMLSTLLLHLHSYLLHIFNEIFTSNDFCRESISYLGKMFGSFACGFASQYFGHRNALVLINIPQFIAFILFYNASSVTKVFIANLLLGFGCGFMKAPCTTFVTEIRYHTAYDCRILCTC